jgi:hypothetical protein
MYGYFYHFHNRHLADDLFFRFDEMGSPPPPPVLNFLVDDDDNFAIDDAGDFFVTQR